MKAEFHLNGSLDVVVENDPGNGIRLTKWEGVCYEHFLGDEKCKERHGEVVVMTKHHARAIASAIMGCAAESD